MGKAKVDFVAGSETARTRILVLDFLVAIFGWRLIVWPIYNAGINYFLRVYPETNILPLTASYFWLALSLTASAMNVHSRRNRTFKLVLDMDLTSAALLIACASVLSKQTLSNLVNQSVQDYSGSPRFWPLGAFSQARLDEGAILGALLDPCLNGFGLI